MFVSWAASPNQSSKEVVDLLKIECLTHWIALIGYSITCVVAIFGVVFRKSPERTLLGIMAASTALHTVALGVRWARLDRVPVVSEFEKLSANIWGLMVAVVIAYYLLRRMRDFVAFVMPVVIMIMAWMMLIPAAESSMPPTYDTIWLFIHIGFIKLFLGAAFVALGLAAVVLLRQAGIGQERLARMPQDNALDRTAYRCMALALIFDTLGVVAGAIWAQDAWGRYWSWDPLEVWSLVTWLTIGLMLHLRASFHTGPAVNAGMIVATWCIAFFTFFGIPFVTTNMHKGMV
jgi:ABC-type transport system involved in cytochrome c biogenesis permease subunit